jgi:integrase
MDTYNKHLKTIAGKAKINKNLTSHIARHTFLTFMADKVSTPTLMRMAQHSDIKTTMQYIHMSEKMKQEELKKVNWEY